jgi:hypothetical protein
MPVAVGSGFTIESDGRCLYILNQKLVATEESSGVVTLFVEGGHKFPLSTKESAEFLAKLKASSDLATGV